MTNTIEPSDLKILAAQRIKTDTDDGGGKNSGREVVDGESNNLFLDISEVNRTTGHTSVQKCYLAVQTDNTAVLQGATAFVSRNPNDPNVSAVLFSTESWDDTTLEAKNRISNYLAKGAQAPGIPMDTHYKGMNMLQVMMWPEENEMSIGQALVVISNENKSNQFEQYNRITDVQTRTAILIVEDKKVEYKIASYQLSESLDADIEGLSATQWYNGQKSVTIVRDTIVADTGKYAASVDLAEDAAVGDFTVMADSVFTQLVPSAQTETPLQNIDAAGQSTALVKTRDSKLSKTFNSVAVSTTQEFYIGSPIMPKSLALTVFGTQITDVGGELKNVNGESVGTIDYQNGLINWTANAGQGTTNITASFTPAAKITAPVESMAIYVTQENNSFFWLRNLVPLPSPGTVVVSYQAQGQIYTLRDNGSGVLRGTDSRFGSATINYDDGSLQINVAELADVGSAILITWSNMITSQDRSNIAMKKAYVEIPLGNSIVASTLQVKWLLNGVQKTATDNGLGEFTGDATGRIDYVDGVAYLEPKLLPNGGTTFEVTGQKDTGKLSVSMSAVPSGGAVNITLDASTAPLIPKSVKVRVPVRYSVVNGESHTGEVELTDLPINSTTGKMVNAQGQQQGTINYSTRSITVSPSVSLSIVEREKVMTPYFGQYNNSAAAIEAGLLGMTINYRNTSKTVTLSLDGVASAVTVAVMYRDNNAVNAISENVVGAVLKTDLTNGFAEQILSGSVRFTLGSSTYVDKIGSLYRNPSVTTGSGTYSGQIHYGNGELEISSWDVGANNNPVLETLATQLEAVQANQVAYRAPMVPIRAQSLTLQATKVEGGVLNITPDANGVIDTADCDGFFNFEQGYGQFVFRQKVEITSANRAEIMVQDWYVAELEYAKDGKQWIHKPIMVLPETIKYSAVSYSYLPIDSELLGLNAVRLPIDGRVPIFRKGEMAIVSAFKTHTLLSHIAGQSYLLPDVRIAWCELRDASGVKIDPALYSINYDAGSVTLGGDFVLGNLTAPVIADYRYQDMRVVKEVKINGELTLNRQLSHNYSAENTIVGSVLFVGDMQARYTNKFVQESWSNVWADVPSGNPISANYNDVFYPIEVTNRGAEQDEWAIVFTSTTAFRIIGKMSGQVGTGAITEDCFPNNPATNAPYFTIRKQGWGSGWQSGHTMRFRTIAATYPVQVIRTVKASDPVQISDSFQIMFRGDRDRII